MIELKFSIYNNEVHIQSWICFFFFAYSLNLKRILEEPIYDILYSLTATVYRFREQ